MNGTVTFGGGSHGFTTDESGGALHTDVAHGGDDAVGDVRPGTHVLGLLLHPHHLGVGVLPDVLCAAVEGEGGELLYAHDGDVVNFVLAAGVQELVVNFTGAHHHALDLVGLADLVGVDFGVHALELGAGFHVCHGGLAVAQTQHVLGGDDDQGLAEFAVDLAHEDVEVVGGGGAVDDLPVGVLDLHAGLFRHVGHDVLVVVCALEEALDAAGAVVRALAVVAVGKEEGEAALTQPFGFSAGNEVIDGYLQKTDTRQNEVLIERNTLGIADPKKLRRHNTKTQAQTQHRHNTDTTHNTQHTTQTQTQTQTQYRHANK